MQRWKCQEFAALWECGLTEFPCCLYLQKCQAQDNEALGTEQKGPNNCTEMTKSSLAWASLSDYHQLGYNLAVNLFQGKGTHCLPRPSKLVPCMLCRGSGSYSAVGRDVTIGNTHFPLIPSIQSRCFSRLWYPFYVLCLSFLSLFFPSQGVKSECES